MKLGVCLASMMIATTVHSKVTKLSSEHRKMLRDEAAFHEIRAKAELPDAIVKLCADGKRRLADPKQKWEPTDYITNDVLPRKRLIWAANSKEIYVVHYESGGYAHSFHLLLAEYKGKGHDPVVIWHAAGFKPLDAYKAFLAEIDAEGTSWDDTLDYLR